VRKDRRQRRFDPLPGHARRQHGQGVSKVDHLVKPGTEKIIACYCFPRCFSQVLTAVILIPRRFRAG
jgi:hypothetical protein